jgi:hypothetical protein
MRLSLLRQRGGRQALHRKISHFVHSANLACSAGYETALHETAKQVIAELGYIWLYTVIKL